jgi:3-oxoacyl-[acyl-carrier-protein] synthase I
LALTEAVHGATASLAGPNERVDDVYCDLNGERYRSEEWGLTLLRSAERFVDGTRTTTATGSWGDMGAASGALSCVLAARAWARDYAAGPLALVWGSSMNGLRSAVLLERP